MHNMSRRFVIFGMARTGSTLLASLLNSHPQIACDGEVFTPPRWPRRLRPIARFWQRHPFPYLAYRQVRTLLLHQKTVYGFKLHNKFEGPQLVDIRGFLRVAAHDGWKVIHLQRRCLFDQVMSNVVANRTGRYFGNQNEDESVATIDIPVTVFASALQKSFRASEFNRAIVAELPCLALVYEDDVSEPAAWEKTAGRICDYLGIPTSPWICSKVAKPWRRRYSEIVTNYAELLSLYQEWEAGENNGAT